MKRIFLISLLFFLAGYCLAQEGTNFEDLTFKEALAIERQRQKIIHRLLHENLRTM